MLATPTVRIPVAVAVADFLDNMKDKESDSKGLGDTVKKVTNALGIKQCEPCKRRQQKLNRLFPYKNKDKTKE